jgi:hypothetical protein
MTCIVGLIHKKKVYMGGDSASGDSSNWHVQQVKNPKVFRNKDFLIGCTTSWRMNQILQFDFDPPKHPKNLDTMKYMVTHFVKEIRRCMEKGGYSKIENNVEQGGEFLVGYAGHIYRIYDDFQVSESIHNLDACGCGVAFALGSLYSTRDWPNPLDRLREALEAAETYSGGVRGPFFFESI